MDDFRLKVFIAAARTLSFTRAAEQLYISQPAVSKHVGELESRYKVQLFTRRGSRLELTEAWALYEASFPDCERWDGTGYDRAFGDPHFEADGIWRGDEFIGILFHWNAGDYRYVEHLAVSPRLRGQNMGSKALAAFCQGRRVILEIDPPEDEISVRRQHFYQRLGFVANPYAYIHPSFRRPFHPHRLVLMSYPEALTYEEARGFADFIRERVLRYSEHENPELPRL